MRAVDEQYHEWLATLAELVRIPSVSGDPAHAIDVERNADVVAAALQVAGLEQVRQRGVDASPPYVLGEGAPPRRSYRAAVRASRRPAAGDRRALGLRSVRASHPIADAGAVGSRARGHARVGRARRWRTLIASQARLFAELAEAAPQT
jgi:hypothetical protein